MGGGGGDKKVVIKLMRINVSQSDRIIDSFPHMLKFKIMILKPVLFRHEMPKARLKNWS